jgi:two-component system sensor histidine kinase PfeS
MNRRLFWKLCLIIATGTVTLFYVINILTSRAEEGMSFIATEHQQQLNAWADHAERLYLVHIPAHREHPIRFIVNT